MIIWQKKKCCVKFSLRFFEIYQVYFQKQNVNKINNVLLGIDESDVSNMHIRIFLKQRFIGYKVHRVINWLEKLETEVKQHLYTLPH